MSKELTDTMNDFVQKLECKISTEEKLYILKNSYNRDVEALGKLKDMMLRVDLSQVDENKRTPKNLKYAISNMIKSFWLNCECTEKEFKSSRFNLSIDENDYLIIKLDK